jgi:hypothetical protein
VVERLYLFRGQKSRKASGAVLFGQFYMIPGAISVQLEQD